LYIVTRSPRSQVAWLTGLTLWSVAGVFLNILLALNPPPVPADPPTWVHTLLPFWPETVFERGWGGWLQGWLVTPAVALWHHVTMLMRPGRMNRWRWARVLAGYAVALVAVVVQLYTPFMFAAAGGDPLYLTTLTPGPLLPLFQLLLLTFIVMSLVNLSRSARAAPSAMPRKQLITLIAATLMAGLTAPVSMAATRLGIPLPRVTLSLLLGCAVVLLGVGVARYSALVEGRVIGRDLVYNAVAVGLVTGLYLAATWLSVRLYRAPAAAFTFVLILAVVTHSLVDVARRALDTVFYRHDQALRANLRRVARVAGEGTALDDYLAKAIRPLGAAVGTTYALLWVFEAEAARLAAEYGWRAEARPALAQADLRADDRMLLPGGRFAPPLAESAALIPLYAEERQVGTLLLGRPVNGVSYTLPDVDRVLEASDQLADAIRTAEREREHLAELARLSTSPAVPGPPVGEIPVRDVEDALRNMTSLTYLGNHALAHLSAVTARLPAHGATHLDRGRALYQVLAETIDKLGPEGKRPRDPIPREWYPYIILHDAYVEDQPNRDIMARLYISEGTFNRTRRVALRAMTRLLEEREAAQA
jgi:GAF domain-containing protein